ncbi:MAG: endonuclease NucS domain-containing protein [Patescibacteria group bacterium UBA2163]
MGIMKSYYRVMQGAKSAHIQDALNESFIGAGWLPDIDLNGKIPEAWRDFNKEFIPVYIEQNPEKSKVAAGLACGMLHTIIKGVSVGDVVLSPSGDGKYHIAEVVGDYEYHPGKVLPHRRPVKWYKQTIAREDMSESLRNSAGSIGTVSNVSAHAEELKLLLEGKAPATIVSADATIEDPSVFALEKHLEDFLEHNWTHMELGEKYDIYEVDGERVGRQYPSDTGPIDILAISKDKRNLLVVELKRGRVTDTVVGQIQRYMGYVKEELAEPGQTVRGAIIGFEDDVKIHRALSVAPNIDFYTYKIQFTLQKQNRTES